MKGIKRIVLPFVSILVFALAGCGGGGGGGGGEAGSGGAPPSLDRDGDGVPNSADAFPDDPARFASYATVLLERLSGGFFGTAVALNDSNEVVGLSEDSSGAIKGVKWTITDGAAGSPVQLNPLPGNGYSAAYGVGEDGMAVGESGKGADFVAVVWPAGSADPAELSLAGLSPPAAAYAASGNRIVGEATDAGTRAAVLWSGASSPPLTLGSLGGASAAYFIHGNLVVGESEIASGENRGVAWILDSAGVPGPPVALPPLSGHLDSMALGINLGGEIVGESEDLAGQVHAVLWRLDAAGIPAPPIDLGVGSAAAINATNRIAGTAGESAQATVWDTRTPLPANAVLDGTFTFSHIYALNNANVAVGLADKGGFVVFPR